MYIHCIIHYSAYYINYKLKLKKKIKALQLSKLYYYLQKLESPYSNTYGT